MAVPAIVPLHRAGAHFVLVRDKVPVWRGWNRRKPSVATAERHLDQDGDIGIVPWSLNETVLDVDHGDPADLHRQLGRPRVVLDSRSRKGAHSWYDDTEPRRNGQFDINGCQGDIRGAGGFVVIHQQQFEKLLDGMRRTGRFMLQADLFEYIAEQVKQNQGAPNPDRPRGHRNTLPVPLEEAVPGNRNVSLFEAARHEIYPLPIPDDFDQWNRTCKDIVWSLASLIDDRKNFDADPGLIAYSISTWCWNRAGHIQRDHSFEAQFRRGVKRYHGDARKPTVDAIIKRNGRICDLYEVGWTQARIASEYNMSQRGISGIIRKAASYGFEVEREKITKAAPWEAEGISRATWYRRQ